MFLVQHCISPNKLCMYYIYNVETHAVIKNNIIISVYFHISQFLGLVIVSLVPLQHKKRCYQFTLSSIARLRQPHNRNVCIHYGLNIIHTWICKSYIDNRFLYFSKEKRPHNLPKTHTVINTRLFTSTNNNNRIYLIHPPVLILLYIYHMITRLNCIFVYITIITIGKGWLHNNIIYSIINFCRHVRLTSIYNSINFFLAKYSGKFRIPTYPSAP